MQGVLVHAAMLSALTATATYASASAGDTALAAPKPAISDGEGAAGGRGVRLAGAASILLFVPGANQSSLIVPVGEGGEGKRGRRFRHHGPRYNPYVGRPYQYRGNYRRDWNEGYYGRSYYDRPYYDRSYRYSPY